jgi:hypothetical protein
MVKMNEYHKIQTIFKRDPKNNFKTLIDGEYSLPEFEYLANNLWEFTEKVDGTNTRIMFDGKSISFGGKTDNADINALLGNKLVETFITEESKHKFTKYFPILSYPDGICLYGEGYGAKIQGGGNYRPDQGFVLFDVKIGDWWLQRKDVEDISAKLGLEIVPIIGRGTLFDMVKLVKAGVTSTWGEFQAEGLVGKPIIELKTRSGHRIITKLKTKDFRLEK